MIDYRIVIHHMVNAQDITRFREIFQLVSIIRIANDAGISGWRMRQLVGNELETISETEKSLIAENFKIDMCVLEIIIVNELANPTGTLKKTYLRNQRA